MTIPGFRGLEPRFSSKKPGSNGGNRSGTVFDLQILQEGIPFILEIQGPYRTDINTSPTISAIITYPFLLTAEKRDRGIESTFGKIQGKAKVKLHFGAVFCFYLCVPSS
jgi:hypothetical protein